MIVSGQTLCVRRPLEPFHERTKLNGLTFGVGPAGYDVRIAESIYIHPGEFMLASTIERFDMPLDMQAVIHDKSTWARLGLGVFNTVIDPGWRGFLTLELVNHGREDLTISSGTPIAHVVFALLDHPTIRPYDGKYQDQHPGPQVAILD